MLISGFTVIIAMAGMLLSGDKTFTSFAIGTMTVVAVAMIGSLTVLPAVLSKLGDQVEKGRIPFVHRLRRDDGEGGRFWGTILRPVLRHPAISAVASAAVLVALALPAFHLHTADSGLDALPKSQPELKAFHAHRRRVPGWRRRCDRGASRAATALRVQAAIADLKTKALASGEMQNPIQTRQEPVTAPRTQVDDPARRRAARTRSRTTRSQRCARELVPATHRHRSPVWSTPWAAARRVRTTSTRR